MWVGYDPADTGDSAGLVVMAPPDKPGGKFRVLEKHQFRGLDYTVQARQIEEITKRYNVTYIGIDVTGLGNAVFQLVKLFFPAVTASSFMAIKKQLTASGRHATYTAGRSDDIGHADLAWAAMHVFANEPMGAGQANHQQSSMEIF